MAVVVSLITFFSTGLGGVAALRFRDHLHLLLGFSAGAVLGVVFFDVLPEVTAVRQPGTPVMLGTAAGYLAFFVLERYTALHQSRAHEHAPQPEHEPELGILGATGLSIHSFFDGVAIGVGFQASTFLGVTIALAVIAHDFTDGMNTVTVMLAHGNSVRRSARFLLLDMTTPILGAASTLVVHLPQTVLPYILAFFAGFLLYIGASDLLPEAREHRSPIVAGATVAGMALVFLVTRFLPK